MNWSATNVFSADCTTKKTMLCQRPKNNCFQENTQINGFNLPNSPTIEDSLQSCQKKCYQTEECNYFMWNTITFKCHLKSEKKTGEGWMVSNPAMIIGAKHCFKCREWGYDYEGRITLSFFAVKTDKMKNIHNFMLNHVLYYHFPKKTC